jgi:hypothetical protein
MRSLWFCGGVRVVHYFSFVVISMCPCVLICLCEDVLFTLFVFVYVVCVCLRCLCLFTYGGVQRMLCCGFFFLRFVYLMLPVSLYSFLDCHFGIL